MQAQFERNLSEVRRITEVISGMGSQTNYIWPEQKYILMRIHPCPVIPQASYMRTSDD